MTDKMLCRLSWLCFLAALLLVVGTAMCDLGIIR